MSCPAANDCFVVGNTEGDFTRSAFAARGDGSTWSTVDLPSASFPVVSDVYCAGASDCTAVGSFYNFPIGFNTLVDHWDGTGWSTVSSPNPALGRTNSLASVTCTSATDCTAVGSTISDAYQRTLVERHT